MINHQILLVFQKLKRYKDNNNAGKIKKKIDY